MQPQSQTIDVGKQAEFHCIVGGHPITKVAWLHDGKPLVKDGRVDVSSDPYRLQVSYFVLHFFKYNTALYLTMNRTL